MSRVTIDFYQAEFKPTASFQALEAVFESLLGKSISIDEPSHTWEVRDLEKATDGSAYRGSLTKLRRTGLPMKAKKGGQEESLGLADDEGLVEKTFFVYFLDKNLLLWQASKMCGGPARLRAVLKGVAGVDVSFNTIVQAGAVERLLEGKGVMKSFEISVAKPTNTDVFSDDQFTSGVLGLLSEAGGDKMVLTFKTDGRLKNGTPLNEKLRQILSVLSARDEVETAKIDLSDEDGNIEPVDLVADRIRAYQDVQHDGKYPKPEAVYAAIHASRDQKSAELAAVFGT